MFLSRGGRDLGVAFQTHLRSQAWYIGEAKNSALLSSPNGYLLSPQSGLKGVRPPVELEERPRDCSPGHAGKEGLEASRGFSGAGEPVWDFSRGMTGSSGSLSCGAREVKSPCEWRGGTRHCSRVMVVESGLNAMKKDARGLSRVAAGNPVFPRLVPVTSGSFSGCL